MEKKAGNDDWDMGLRIVGRRALWDPIMFLDWLNNNKVKNKPKDQRDVNLIAFVRQKLLKKRKCKTMKTKQQLTRDYQYLFEMADQLLLAYQNDIFDEEIEDLTKCLEELSGNTLKRGGKNLIGDIQSL